MPAMPALPAKKAPASPAPSAADTAFGEFLAAERQQESGGRYGVVNSIGAAGAYQIMGYHIPAWSKAALGHSISEHEFLTHPAEQDAIAAYELRPVYDKHGPRGAAAWWYSGQWQLANDYKPQKGGPSIGAYVDQVVGRIGKAGSVSPGSGATPADDTSGTSARTAGLQQAGYDAQIDLNAWGVPLNPLKLPGWLASQLEGAAGDAAGGAASGMWDAIGPAVLASIGAVAGAGIFILGLYVTARPRLDQASAEASQLATLAV